VSIIYSWGGGAQHPVCTSKGGRTAIKREQVQKCDARAGLAGGCLRKPIKEKQKLEAGPECCSTYQDQPNRLSESPVAAADLSRNERAQVLAPSIDNPS